MNIVELHGVGKRTASLLKKLKIETVEDLLEHYPRRYELRPKPILISQMKVGDTVAIRCRITKPVVNKSSGLSILYVSDHSGSTSCRWFHNPYLSRLLQYSNTYVFLGTVSSYMGQDYLIQPQFFPADEYDKLIGSLYPIYPLTSGIANKTIMNLAAQAFSYIDPEETIPEEVRYKYQLIHRSDAIRCIHYPGSQLAYDLARNRLVFDEFYHLLYSLSERAKTRGKNHYRVYHSETADSIIQNLPYELTGSQKEALCDIWNDFEKELVADRLVQGDVGSGKTLVAILSMVKMADNGFQSVLMAPTEVLATQHFEELKKLVGDKFSPVLLTGSMKAKEKSAAYEKIASGESLLIVGTHTVIQEKVQYKHLALAIIDEQHRFGVEQREKLSKKGAHPVHTIIMTATPIPGTTGKILFAGMDISIMRDKPAGRTPILNYTVDEPMRPWINGLIQERLDEGHQVYVICPLVAPGKNADTDDGGKQSVEECVSRIKKEFPDIKIASVHGKLPAKEKAEAMECFASGKAKILVATTVVEVGVNVPNATLIIIEGANNFGMLQLHQLRGRVGRGSDQSYCVFVNSSSTPCERLEIMCKTNDGFQIAEEDYRLRKAGDLLGTRQSGDMGFKLADIVKDENLLRMAKEAVDAQFVS